MFNLVFLEDVFFPPGCGPLEHLTVVLWDLIAPSAQVIDYLPSGFLRVAVVSTRFSGHPTRLTTMTSASYTAPDNSPRRRKTLLSVIYACLYKGKQSGNAITLGYIDSNAVVSTLRSPAVSSNALHTPTSLHDQKERKSINSKVAGRTSKAGSFRRSSRTKNKKVQQKDNVRACKPQNPKDISTP
jgi:hypothetical protein